MKRALFVIDVQNEYFDGAMPVSYPQGSFPNILRAMDAAASVPITRFRSASAVCRAGASVAPLTRSTAASVETTDWPAIRAYYDRLIEIDRELAAIRSAHERPDDAD